MGAISGDTPKRLLPRVLAESVSHMAGVEAVCFAPAPLMHKIGLKTSVAVPGQQIERQSFLNTSLNRVSEDYFSTLRIPILEGRSLSRTDEQTAKLTPVVINNALARLLFSNKDPIGKSFGSGPPGSAATQQFVVVGMAGDSKYRSLRERVPPIFYEPFQRGPGGDSDFTMYVRAAVPFADLVSRMRVALFHLDSSLAFSDMTTMRREIRDSVWADRLVAVLGILLSVISGLMAAAGLYGVLSFETNRRYRECGIRLALGATANDLAIMLIKDGSTILIPGLLIGLATHECLAGSISPFLFGVAPSDAVSLWAAISSLD